MKTYKIADIILSISYLYQGYLDDNIEKYETSSKKIPKYHIDSISVDHITEPKTSSLKKKNPYIVRGKDVSYFYIKNKNNEVKAMFKHDPSFHHSTIFLNEKLLEDPAEIEYVFMSMIFMEIASREGFISLHASAISYQHEAILISAPSQTGKSTHASYWLKAFDSCSIINDDKPLIKIDHDHLYVYGTPFSGKGKRNENTKVKLKSIVFLNQGSDNHIDTPDLNHVMTLLLKNMHRPIEEDLWNMSLSMLDKIIQTISFYTIDATHSMDAAKTLHKHIYQGAGHEN